MTAGASRAGAGGAAAGVRARRRALGRAALRPVDIASLAVFRMIFGGVMLLGIARLLTSGWIEVMYREPRWFFSYPGFAWVRPWPGVGMYVHYGVLAALALAIAVGAYHRAACALFVVGFAYTQLIDVTNYLNHHYLVVLLGALLAVLPANAAWSIDARRRPALRRATVPAWMVWLVRFQVGVVYVFAGLAKAKTDWLVHGQPLGLWLAARTEAPVVGGVLAQPWAALAMSWAGFLFDTTIVAWLSWARTRRYAYAVVIAFHGATGALFNIGMFPIIMTSAALIFFSPSWPRHVLAKLGARRLAAAPELHELPELPELHELPELPELPELHETQDTPDRRDVPDARAAQGRNVAPPSRALRVAIALHVALQVALPLRHLAYPGDVLWNEDGMRFAWHVLIREKHGKVSFVARFADGRRLQVPPRDYLTARQDREMSGQPDLILQLARHIGRDLAARGYRGFTLHALTQVSINGRAPTPMIDPEVDLLAVRDVGPRTWVLPAPAAPPAQVRAIR